MTPTTAWKTFERTERLRYRLPRMGHKIQDAERILKAFFRRSKTPAVSFSGGKDSLVALDLALALHPHLRIVWHDEGWYPPGTEEAMSAIEAYYGVHVIRVHRWPLSGHWMRKYGQEVVCTHLKPAEYDGYSWREIYAHYGLDGAIVAMRCEESTVRRFALKRPLRWHKGQRVWRVSPIHDWTYHDVWAYILGKRLPYHPAYEKMIDGGVEPKHARIGPLSAERVYQYGALATLKRLWPDTWNRFVSENPCVAAEA